MILNVNDSEFIRETNRLESIRKKSMPFAIRNTLNDVAFRTRKKQLKKTKNKFTNRSPKFFSSRLNVKKAKGVKVPDMQSASGIYARNNNKSEFPVKNLRQQDQGGPLYVGSVPTKKARGGGRKNKVQSKNRLTRAKVKGESKGIGKKGYIARHAIAAKTGKLMKNKSSIYRVTGIHFAAGGRVSFNKELLYVRHYGKKNYRKRPFIKPEDQWVRKIMKNEFTKNVNKQLNFVRK